MRILILALSLCLAAPCQTASLKADLLSPSRDDSTRQAVDHMMQLAEKTHEPPLGDVVLFASGLIHSFNPPATRERQADRIVAEIDSVLKSAGTSTIAFHEHVASFEALMLTAGASKLTAHRLATQLENIGMRVRGPEDIPLR